MQGYALFRGTCKVYITVNPNNSKMIKFIESHKFNQNGVISYGDIIYDKS